MWYRGAGLSHHSARSEAESRNPEDKKDMDAATDAQHDVNNQAPALVAMALVKIMQVVCVIARRAKPGVAIQKIGKTWILRLTRRMT